MMSEICLTLQNMFKHYNYPKKVNTDIYIEAIQTYIDIVSQYDEVQSIIQIGNIGVAGISDIDLIVFLDEKKNCSRDYSIYQIPKKFHQILMHDVFIIPFSIAKYTGLITSVFESKHLYGKKISFNHFCKSDNFYKDLILLNDLAIVSLLFEYDLFWNIKRKNIKLIIARINSIKYPINLLIKLYRFQNIKLDNLMLYDEFIRSFSKFRKSWFNNANEKNLNELWHYLNFCKKEL